MSPTVGQSLFYVPSARALAMFPALAEMTAPIAAKVDRAHADRLVDIVVPVSANAEQLVRLLPLLLDGDPDPQAPLGYAQLAKERKPAGPVALNAGTPYAFTLHPDGTAEG